MALRTRDSGLPLRVPRLNWTTRGSWTSRSANRLPEYRDIGAGFLRLVCLLVSWPWPDACWPPAAAVGGARDRLGGLLDFAARSRLPAGGFGYLGDDGRVLARPAGGYWIVARMTHVFGLAHLLALRGGRTGPARGRRADRRPAARRRERRLAGEHGRRHEGRLSARVRHAGGLDAPRPGSTGGADAPAGGARTSGRSGFWDDAAGLAVEEWDRTWTRLDGYRGLNANMHGVEASLAAADALPVADQAGKRQLRPRRYGAPNVWSGWARECRLAAARALHRRLDAAPRLQPRPSGRPVPPVRRDRRAPFEWARLAPTSGGHRGPPRVPARRRTEPVLVVAAGRRRRRCRDPVHRRLGGPRRRPRAGCTGSSARRSPPATCWRRPPGTSPTGCTRTTGGTLGERLFADPSTGQLAPTSSRRPGRAAEPPPPSARLPPGPDAAARGPTGRGSVAEALR